LPALEWEPWEGSQTLPRWCAASKARRLPTRRIRLFLSLLVGGLAACPASEKAPAPNTRYQAVKAARTAKAPPAEWCDLEFAAGTGARLVLPPAAPARKPVGALTAGRWVWLNMWATWCKPCLREMPLLLDWRDRLRQDGVALDVWFLSLDEEADELAKFLAGHPEVAPAPSLRASSPGDFKKWASTYLFDAAAQIPVHVLAAPDGRIRCIHNGSLNEADYATVAAWLR